MTGHWAVYLGHSLQLLLASIFIVAAVTKLRRPSRFLAALRGYELLPARLTAPTAGMVVALELFVALSLFSGWALDVGVVAVSVLLSAFALVVGINLRRGHVVSCGCFGSSTERISRRTLGRIGLLMLAGITLGAVRLSGTSLPTISNLVTASAGLQQLVLTAAFALLLLMSGTWLLHVPELTMVFRPARVKPERSLDA